MIIVKRGICYKQLQLKKSVGFTFPNQSGISKFSYNFTPDLNATSKQN